MKLIIKGYNDAEPEETATLSLEPDGGGGVWLVSYKERRRQVVVELRPNGTARWVNNGHFNVDRR